MISIELDAADALVLFEFLARHDEHDNDRTIRNLEIDDRAELFVLWTVHAALERALVESFAPDYRQRVDAARATVRERWGE